MQLFRVQNKANAGSMWYNPDGSSNRLVDKLSSNRLAQLPMDFDPRYREDGKIWQCAAWDINHLNDWFTLQDMKELLAMDFHVVKFQSKEFIKEENQVLFTMRSIYNVEDITDMVLPNLK